jgi:hypothetical protein
MTAWQYSDRCVRFIECFATHCTIVEILLSGVVPLFADVKLDFFLPVKSTILHALTHDFLDSDIMYPIRS